MGKAHHVAFKHGAFGSPTVSARSPTSVSQASTCSLARAWLCQAEAHGRFSKCKKIHCFAGLRPIPGLTAALTGRAMGGKEIQAVHVGRWGAGYSGSATLASSGARCPGEQQGLPVAAPLLRAAGPQCPSKLTDGQATRRLQCLAWRADALARRGCTPG